MSKPEDAARNRSDVGIGVDMQQNGWQPIFGKRNKKNKKNNSNTFRLIGLGYF